MLGFTNMLAKLLSETDADHIAVIFDYSARTSATGSTTPTRRNGRSRRRSSPQFALVREPPTPSVCAGSSATDYEADDLIATYTRQAVEAGRDVTIVSSDKDLMQLVSDRMTMLDPIAERRSATPRCARNSASGPTR